MKEMKVILSPFVGTKSYTDEVSGMTFDLDEYNAKIYTISLEGLKGEGILKALQRNILVAVDDAAVAFAKGEVKASEPVVEEVKEVVEEVKVEIASEEVVEEATAPKKRKKA